MTDQERKRKERPRDINQLAKSIVDIATGEVEDREPTPEEQGKDPAAVSLGRRGGLKGGKARAEKMTAKQRSAVAKKAATARWSKKS
ncbi:MAG: histone H1 [Hyphomicrobiaceae bacterium]|nr:histone H1 [Hyphomicrobiaceae bacterium]